MSDAPVPPEFHSNLPRVFTRVNYSLYLDFNSIRQGAGLRQEKGRSRRCQSKIRKLACAILQVGLQKPHGNNGHVHLERVLSSSDTNILAFSKLSSRQVNLSYFNNCVYSKHLSSHPKTIWVRGRTRNLQKVLRSLTIKNKI